MTILTDELNRRGMTAWINGKVVVERMLSLHDWKQNSLDHGPVVYKGGLLGEIGSNHFFLFIHRRGHLANLWFCVLV